MAHFSAMHTGLAEGTQLRVSLVCEIKGRFVGYIIYSSKDDPIGIAKI